MPPSQRRTGRWKKSRRRSRSLKSLLASLKNSAIAAKSKPTNEKLRRWRKVGAMSSRRFALRWAFASVPTLFLSHTISFSLPRTECPLLKTVKFTYRPELRSTQQAEIDLKDFIAACKKRTRQEAARKRKSKQHQQHEGESSQLSAGEDSAEDQHRGHKKKKKEPVVVKSKAGQVSAVKPRALLDTFSQDDGEDAEPMEDIDDADEDADAADADPETTGLPEDTIDDDDDEERRRRG